MGVFAPFESLVSGKLGNILTLMRLEARLAGLSVYPLVVNLFTLFIVIIAVWLSGMFLLGYAFYALLHSALAAILIIFVLNVTILVFSLKYLLFNLRKLSFEKTRKYLLNRGLRA